MNKSVIINYKIEEQKITTLQNDIYKIKNKSSKLNNLIIKLLIKFKILMPYFEDTFRYKRVEIKPEKIIDFIKDSMHDIYSASDKNPTKVILGFDQMQKLNIECYYDLTFHMPIELNGNQGKKIFGLEIVLNPRIDGVIVM